MGKKRKLKAIKALAAQLPLVNQHTSEVHIYTGAEILAWGTITHIDGERIDPEKQYTYRMPVMIMQNGSRRMKRAYLKDGVKGIGNILSQINLLRSDQLLNHGNK